MGRGNFADADKKLSFFFVWKIKIKKKMKLIERYKICFIVYFGASLAQK